MIMNRFGNSLKRVISRLPMPALLVPTAPAGTPRKTQVLKSFSEVPVTQLFRGYSSSWPKSSEIFVQQRMENNERPSPEAVLAVLAVGLGTVWFINQLKQRAAKAKEVSAYTYNNPVADAMVMDGAADESWEQTLQTPDMTVYKKAVPSGPTLYKVEGRFEDVTAHGFYRAQIDNNARISWDKSVLSLETLDTAGNSSLVYWSTKFPWRLASRDYLFERSASLDLEKGQYTVINRSVTSNLKPPESKLVRVTSYGSKIVIKGDRGVQENGMTFILTYYDDFGAPVPKWAMDWIASTKIPEFLANVREAAQQFDEEGKDKD